MQSSPEAFEPPVEAPTSPSFEAAEPPSFEVASPLSAEVPPSPSESIAPPPLDFAPLSSEAAPMIAPDGADRPTPGILAESFQSLTLDVETTEDHFSAQEPQWPELSQHGAVMRPPALVPGAIPTDAMAGDRDRGVARAGLDIEAAEPSPSEELVARDDADVAGGDDLEVVDGAETLDALPAEALSDAASVLAGPSESTGAAPPPSPRPAAAPPPIPVGSPRRKTGEVRAPEVPTAQVVASIVPAGRAPRACRRRSRSALVAPSARSLGSRRSSTRTTCGRSRS